jgi:hypothetical protein
LGVTQAKFWAQNAIARFFLFIKLVKTIARL